MNLACLAAALLIFYIWYIFDNPALIVAAFALLVLSCTMGGHCRECGGGGGDRSWADKLSLIDPKFNLREAAKQMILLEDHLFHQYKHCLDCISKHALFIEGLLEEGLTMDIDGAHADETRDVLTRFRALLPPHIQKMQNGVATTEDYIDTANHLRELRKPLAQKYAYYDAK